MSAKKERAPVGARILDLPTYLPKIPLGSYRWAGTFPVACRVDTAAFVLTGGNLATGQTAKGTATAHRSRFKPQRTTRYTLTRDELARWERERETETRRWVEFLRDGPAQ